jgi:hypothetical protein
MKDRVSTYRRLLQLAQQRRAASDGDRLKDVLDAWRPSKGGVLVVFWGASTGDPRILDAYLGKLV